MAKRAEWGLIGLFFVRYESGRRDGARGVRAPFAPGTAVEPPGRKTRELHGEHIVAGRDARAAHVDRDIGARAGEQLLVLGAQLPRRLEAPVGCEVRLPEPVHRAGDVARDRINRLLLAAETLGGARVDQLERRVLVESLDETHVDGRAGTRMRNEGARTRRGNLPRERPSLLLPKRETAVEERHALVPQPAQHPPQAHGAVAAEVVVRYRLHAGSDTACVHLRGEGGDVRERGAPVLAGLGAGQVLA